MSQSLLVQRISKAKLTNDFLPIWDVFLNTLFYVRVIRSDEGPQTKDFRFVTFKSTPEAEPVVIASEDPTRLVSDQSIDIIRVPGGKLIGLLNPNLGIVIPLSDQGVFGMPASLVTWLRSITQKT